MSTFIIIKNIDVNIYNVNEYIKLQMYLFNKNYIIKIKRDFYIVDDFVIKAFVEINIMKSKNIILDIEKNVIIIDLYKNIQFLSRNNSD